MNAATRAFPVLVFATAAFAADITLKDGQVLKNAEISKVDAAFVSFKHGDGIARVPFENLPDELQKKYGYDPQKAATFVKGEAVANAAQASQKEKEAAYRKLNSMGISVKVQIIQALNDVAGALVEFPGGLDLCYVGRIGNVADNTPWQGTVWKIGTYQYKSVDGLPRTVVKYTANRVDAALALGFAPKHTDIVTDTGKTLEFTSLTAPEPAFIDRIATADNLRGIRVETVKDAQTTAVQEIPPLAILGSIENVIFQGFYYRDKSFDGICIRVLVACSPKVDPGAMRDWRRDSAAELSP